MYLSFLAQTTEPSGLDAGSSFFTPWLIAIGVLLSGVVVLIVGQKLGSSRAARRQRELQERQERIADARLARELLHQHWYGPPQAEWYIPFERLSVVKPSGSFEAQLRVDILNIPESRPLALAQIGRLAELIADLADPSTCCAFTYDLFFWLSRSAVVDGSAVAAVTKPIVDRFQREVDRDRWLGAQFLRALLHTAPLPIGRLFAIRLQTLAQGAYQGSGLIDDQRRFLNEWGRDAGLYLAGRSGHLKKPE